MDRWLQLSEEDGKALLDLVQSLKIGENHLRDFLDWIEEISLRDGAGIYSILRGGPISRILATPELSRNDKLKRVKEELHRLRFPRLSQIQEEIYKRIRELRVRPQIQLTVPPGLEGGTLTVQMRATSYEELRLLAAELKGLLERDALKEIFALLSGSEQDEGRVVVSWSMNPQRVIEAEEHLTASFDERLTAARRCQEAGYRLGFHFDPMIEYPGWEEDYREMVERVFAAVDHHRIAWISLGVLRHTPVLKRIMRQRFSSTRLLAGEQVLCPDGKMRYFQPLRVSMYRKILRWIRSAAPTVFVYLCMESREVWEQVFGFAPSCEKELGYQLTSQA